MSDEPFGSCTVCARRDPARGTVCDGCRSRLSGWLGELPGLYADLLTLGFVERDGHTSKVAYPAGHIWAGQAVPHFDPVANSLTAGPLCARNGDAHVSGTPAASVPISLDATDLTAGARVMHLASPHARDDRLLPCRYCRAYHATGSYRPQDGRHDPRVDQAGHLPAASVLDGWVRDWRDARGRGEGLPVPEVPVLCRWLRDRLDDACDTHPAMADFATELRALRAALFGQLGLFDIPEYKDGVRCRSCDAKDLWRHSASEYVECNSCGLLLSPAEYKDWTGLLAAHVKGRAA